MKQWVFFLVFITSIFQIQSIFGQQRICLDFGTQFGSTGLNFEGARLENLKPVFNQNALFAGIQYKIGNYLEFGFHIRDQKNSWKYTDNQVISLANGEYVKIESKSTVLVRTFSGSMTFLKPFESKEKLQWQLTTGYNFGNTKPSGENTEFFYSDAEISLIQSNSQQKYTSAFIESGLNFNLSRLIDFKLSAGYNYSFQPIFECKYSLQTPEYSATSIISSNGSGAYLGASLAFVLINIKKREKKPPKYNPQFNDKNEVTYIDDREVITNQEIKVESELIEIQLWDYGKEDGDKISLFLDGTRLLKKYILTNKRKKLKVTLKPGTTKLIVYAHNLGKDPPNTASVIVDDGKSKHLLSLQSTLGECGSISIIYEP